MWAQKTFAVVAGTKGCLVSPRSPQENKNGFAQLIDDAAQIPILAPRFGGELEWAPVSFEVLAPIPAFPRGGGRSNDELRSDYFRRKEQR
jgi:hypothetical protein